jgi:hypothetical protein
MDYIGRLVEEADPSIDFHKVPIFLASDGQKPETEEAIRTKYPNVVQWGNARCNKALKRAGSKHVSSTAPDIAWLDALMLVGSSVFVGQIGSSFSANVAVIREADGRSEKTNILAGYAESGYRVMNGLSATDE